MPRLVPFMSSFGAGEVSPTIYARPDVQKYASACQIIENYHNLPQGGVTRRPRTGNWSPQPPEEFGARPASDLLVSAVTGDNITLEAKNSIAGITTFFESDCGREVVVTSGANAGARVGIKAYTSATIVLGAVCEAFVNLTATCQGGWKITGSPRTGVTPSAKAPVGKRITLTLDTPGWRQFPDPATTPYQ